jgi:hypothetical protein
MEHRLVAHFLDGRLIKGVSCSVASDRPICHVRTAEQGTVAVPLSQLKALFFVRDLVGDPRYQDAQVIGQADRRATGAKRLQLTFRDGEQLVAIAPTYEATRDFFFVLPADPHSNNVRILLNRGALASVLILPREIAGGPGRSTRAGVPLATGAQLLTAVSGAGS